MTDNMKTCTKCKIEKDTTEFFNKSGKNSHRLQSECKDCFRKRMNKRVSENTLKIKQLLGSKCVVCGYDKCSAALEYHHIDPTIKEFAISKARSRSIEKIKEEIDKCVLLCSNCHREVHAGLITLGV